MCIIVIPYRSFKDRINITKKYKDYYIEDIGNNMLMLSKNILLN